MSKTIDEKRHEQWRADLVAWESDVAGKTQELVDATADRREVEAMLQDSLGRPGGAQGRVAGGIAARQGP